jgi:hypothetical protein
MLLHGDSRYTTKKNTELKYRMAVAIVVAVVAVIALAGAWTAVQLAVLFQPDQLWWMLAFLPLAAVLIADSREDTLWVYMKILTTFLTIGGTGGYIAYRQDQAFGDARHDHETGTDRKRTQSGGCKRPKTARCCRRKSLPHAVNTKPSEPPKHPVKPPAEPPAKPPADLPDKPPVKPPAKPPVEPPAKPPVEPSLPVNAYRCCQFIGEPRLQWKDCKPCPKEVACSILSKKECRALSAVCTWKGNSCEWNGKEFSKEVPCTAAITNNMCRPKK